MDTQPLAVVHGKMQEDLNNLQIFLNDGRAKDYPDYKFVVGQIRGINVSMQIVKDLANNMEGDDNG